MRIGVDARALIAPRTGIGKFVEGMLGALARADRGHEFVLFTPRSISFDPPSPRWRVRRFRGPGTNSGNLWLQIYGPWLAMRERVDVFWGPMFLLPVLLTSRIPMLVTVHDLVYVFYPQTMQIYNYLALRTLIGPSLRRARHITADSQATADDLHRQLAVPADKISVVYPGVAPQFHLRDAEDARRHLAAALGLRPPYLLTVSTHEPRKNLATLVQAFATLPAAFRHRWPLVIAGAHGWKSSAFHAVAAPLLREGSVRMLGYVSDVDLPWLYAGATLFLFPSVYEGFGMPVIEAMASGVPVALSDIPMLREVAGDAAPFVPATDGQAWAKAIRELIEDPARRQTLREVGLRRAARFSFDESAGHLLNILERVAQQ